MDRKSRITEVFLLITCVTCVACDPPNVVLDSNGRPVDRTTGTVTSPYGVSRQSPYGSSVNNPSLSDYSQTDVSRQSPYGGQSVLYESSQGHTRVGFPGTNYGQSNIGYGTIGIGQSPDPYGPLSGSSDPHAGQSHSTDYRTTDLSRQTGVNQPPYAMGIPGQISQVPIHMPGPQMPSYTGGSPDRQFNLFPAENCVERSVYFARSCEDFLLQRQREARNARTGIDVQRRLCCSLFFYHDCLSKTVIQYCRDASPTTVDIMMGQRKREMAITCRDFSREQCSSASDLKSWSRVTLLVLSSLFLVSFVSS